MYVVLFDQSYFGNLQFWQFLVPITRSLEILRFYVYIDLFMMLFTVCIVLLRLWFAVFIDLLMVQFAVYIDF